MTTIDRVDAYSVPSGKVAVIDGVPQWPWELPAARARLVRVASRCGLALTGDEIRLDSGSNDVWRLGADRFLRICWRGDRDRFIREASMAATVPVPYPRPLDFGTDGELSWILCPRVAGRTLGEAFADTRPSRLRAHVRELAGLLQALHGWQPPGAVPPPTSNDAIGLVGGMIIPHALDDQLTLVSYAATLPFVDADLLADAAAALTDAHATLDFTTDQVFTHGDVTPNNIIVDGGRITALLDFEWARPAPRDAELLLPTLWRTWSSPDIAPQRLLDWLAADYPELFAAPDLDRRLWVYEMAFMLSGFLRWPLEAPEDMAEQPHARHVRRLLAEFGG